MKILSKAHHRRSIRMQGYDYSLPGAYFVTLVTTQRIHLFGEISNGVMHSNHLGEVIQSAWQHLPDSFSIQLDEWVIMPNHLHGIIWIMDSSQGEASTDQGLGKFMETLVDASPLHRPCGTQRGSLGAVIQNLKSISTRKIHQSFRRGEAFAKVIIFPLTLSLANASPKLVWQRNYYDRIIRDEKELDLIRLYIFENPRQWVDDPENCIHK